MPWSRERKNAVLIYGVMGILIVAALAIVVEYPELLNPPQKPNLQILSKSVVDERNSSGDSQVNASFTVTIQNTGTINETRTLVCSVKFQTDSGYFTYENRTVVSLAPGETRTYYPVVVLPDVAKSVDWTISAIFED